MIDKIDNWDNLEFNAKNDILIIFLDKSINTENLVGYFEKYKEKLTNNTLNSFIKGVINL